MKMKTPKIIPGLSAAVMALLTVSATAATPFYAGFESGDFTGWTVSIPDGMSEFGPDFIRPAGSANVVSSFGVPQASPISPVDGSYFAAIGTSGNAYFTNREMTYNISASQSLPLNEGDTLLGWAAFYNGDYEPQDTAWVSILNDVGVQLSIPWQAISGGLGGGTPTTPYKTATPWTMWEWVAPQTGSYTLALGVTTFGDDRFASFGLFDDIKVLPIAVPEPSSSLLLGGALMILLGSWRKSKQRAVPPRFQELPA